MKRIALSLILATMSVIACFGRGIMSFSEAQQQAYFLTDKMAYELDLTPMQYDQVYQVNLEYFLNVDGVDPWGYYWNYRNTDLSYILFDWQYGLYCRAEYFYRPIKWRHRSWYLPVWDYYQRTYFYYDRPSIWNTWRGGLWTGRIHNSPSPFVGHRPNVHNGGMRHDPYPGGHPGHPGGHPDHNGGHPGYNGGGHYGGNNGGGQPGYNGGGSRPGGNNGGGQPGYNGGGSRPGGNNGGGAQPGGGNRPNNGGGAQPGGGNRPNNGGGAQPGGGNRPNNGGGAQPGGGNRPNNGGGAQPGGGAQSGGSRGGASVGGSRGGGSRGGNAGGGSHGGGNRSFGGRGQ